MKYKTNFSKDQLVFFPETVNDYIGATHLARFVELIVEQLDFTDLDKSYKSTGQRAYNPRVLTAIIFYGYAIGIFSSRKLEDSCVNRLDFRFLSNNFFPSYKTISEFRRIHLEFLQQKFTEIVVIGLEMGAVSIGNIKVSLDGTKIRANASSKKTKTRTQLKALLEQAETEVKTLLSDAEQIDKQEDIAVGDRTKSTISEAVMKRQSKIKAIQDTLSSLDEKIEKDKDAAVQQKGKALSKSEESKIENQKMNMTDQDAKYMKERQGCTRTNYNCQITVDETHQFITATDVTNSACDQYQLQPMLEQSEANLGCKIDVIKADSGYENKKNLAYLEERKGAYYIDSCNVRAVNRERFKYNKINFKYLEDKDAYECPVGQLVPFYRTGRRSGKASRKYKCTCSATCPFKNECCPKNAKVIDRFADDYLLEANLAKMQQEEIRAEYSIRKHTVEPVFGDLKHNRKFTQFLLRGLQKVKAEFRILCIAFNIRKLHKLHILSL